MLDVKNLSFNYGPIQALKDVSFQVNKGEIVTMLGANGAGKTTLLKTISGLQKPSQGLIFYNNEDITALPPEKIVQKRLIHVPEHRQVFSTLTVTDNLFLGAFHHYKKSGKKEIYNSVEKVFELFPILKERKDQLAGTLSGGQQQMLAVARALMAKPELLLLDEPSLGLAPLIVKEVLLYVKNLRDEFGVTVLLIEQNVNASLKIADRGYVMSHGSIVKEGTSAELLDDVEVREAFLGQTVN
ncbi:MAG TPA: ABC transporter ATP-binding protein [Bacillus sp. (in: firmicutes)]|uniref:ABC transporter ATP-binding protein n=1 Tax=Bacillus litorisediminis TaxID=2922713 RepID=UPI001FAE969F|nr:ABC transporter ATP-binding protein [Bacillus litorisediminis]HWO75250.1 ABC transporter ATP-binding protein [Bacillus sp. (in: firmicutes)]